MANVKINLNKVATAVAAVEGKKNQLNIADIKEVISCFLKEISQYDDALLLEMVGRYRKASNL